MEIPHASMLTFVGISEVCRAFSAAILRDFLGIQNATEQSRSSNGALA
jgi:hypothetical protein